MKHFKEELVLKIDLTDLDAKYPYYEGEVRNEVEQYDGNEVPSLNINKLISDLNLMKDHGCNKVTIEPHIDHRGYYLYGLKLTEVDEAELSDHAKILKSLYKGDIDNILIPKDFGDYYGVIKDGFLRLKDEDKKTVIDRRYSSITVIEFLDLYDIIRLGGKVLNLEEQDQLSFELGFNNIKQLFAYVDKELNGAKKALIMNFEKL